MVFPPAKTHTKCPEIPSTGCVMPDTEIILLALAEHSEKAYIYT
jgi:hypothetical protein